MAGDLLAVTQSGSNAWVEKSENVGKSLKNSWEEVRVDVDDSLYIYIRLVFLQQL